jgi:hypothetical protein
MCKAAALLCKTLHSVQLRNSPQTPQRAWVETPFALPPSFAQKKDTKPVGGRGISAFSAVFFVTVEFSVGNSALCALNAVSPPTDVP